MKLLLDNCVHIGSKRLFAGHTAVHASERGWQRLANRALIAAAAADGFDVLVTTDKYVRHQHNLATLPISLLELNSRFTRLPDLRALQPHFERALAATAGHLFVSVRSDGTPELFAPRLPFLP